MASPPAVFSDASLTIGLLATAALVSFYVVTNAALQLVYYWRRAGSLAAWKLQPRVTAPCTRAHVPRIPLLNLLCGGSALRPSAAPNHALIVSLNVAMVGVFAGVSAAAIAEGYSTLRFDPIDSASAIAGVLLEGVGYLLLAHQIEEYYWHRLLHWAPLYKRFHKYHHAYKSPSPFDDMYISNLEAAGYYVILWSPPFVGHALAWAGRLLTGGGLVPIQPQPALLLPFSVVSPHFASFLLYMSVVGTTGILDHSGEKLGGGGAASMSAEGAMRILSRLHLFRVLLLIQA